MISTKHGAIVQMNDDDIIFLQHVSTFATNYI